MINFIYSGEGFNKQIEYSFRTIINFLTDENYEVAVNKSEASITNDGLVITYGERYFDVECSKRIHIYQSRLFGKDYLKPCSLPEKPLKRYRNIPVVYSGKTGVENRVMMQADTIRTDIDILASAFFMLTRYEEYLLQQRDNYNRFKGSDSLAYEERFIGSPIVNQYIELLWEWIKHLYPKAERRTLWGDRSFAAFISHDIDHIRKFRTIYPAARYFLLEQDISKGCRAGIDFIRSLLNIENDPAYCLDTICRLESRYGFRSSFYWMTSSSYRMDSRHAGKLLEIIRAFEGEIGLHPNTGTYNCLEKLAAEKSKMEKVLGYRVEGCRHHYLQVSAPLTWRIQEQLGLKYDASFGFHDIEGYRCGICYPYRAFDLEENRMLNLVEVPLVIMDTTLNARYNAAQSIEVIKQHIDTCRMYKGIISLLWHNDALDSYDWDGWNRIIEEALQYLHKLEPLSITGCQAANTLKQLWGKW